MKALVIVDVQLDFLPGGALAVPNGDEIIPLINELQQYVDLVVATQDWHPPGHKSFASAHPGKKPFEMIKLEGLEQVLWPNHCVQGSEGAGFSPDLNMNHVEAIFRKGMEIDIDSYSGFYDNGHRKATGMGAYLKGRGITDIWVCGLASDYCVYFTALDGLELGFKTTLIEDASRPIDATSFELKKEHLLSKGGQIGHAKKILLKM